MTHHTWRNGILNKSSSLLGGGPAHAKMFYFVKVTVNNIYLPFACVSPSTGSDTGQAFTEHTHMLLSLG